MAGDYLDETHQRISEFADEFLSEDEEERDGFVDGLMERRGYKRGTHWAPPEPEGDSGKKGLLKPKTPARGGQGGSSSYFKGAAGRK